MGTVVVDFSQGFEFDSAPDFWVYFDFDFDFCILRYSLVTFSLNF